MPVFLIWRHRYSPNVDDLRSQMLRLKTVAKDEPPHKLMRENRRSLYDISPPRKLSYKDPDYPYAAARKRGWLRIDQRHVHRRRVAR